MHTIAEFFALDETVLRERILKGLNDEQVADVMQYGETFPFLDVSVSMSSAHPDAAGDEPQDGIEKAAVFPAGDLITVGYVVRRLDLAEHRARAVERHERVVEAEKERTAQLAAAKAAQGKGKKGGKKTAKKAIAASITVDSVNSLQGDAVGAGANSSTENNVNSNSTVVAATNADDANEMEHEGSEAGSDDSDGKGSEMDDDELWDVETRKESQLDALDADAGIPVVCPRYPHPKVEWWWCVLGAPRLDKILPQTNSPKQICLNKLVNLTDEKEVCVVGVAWISSGVPWELKWGCS